MPCRFIDDCAEESDHDEESDCEPGGKGKRRRKRRRIVQSADEDEGEELTKEDIDFVVDDHESPSGHSPRVRISRKERRITRDDVALIKENVGLGGRRRKERKERLSVWKDEDELDACSADEGFVVEDDSEDEELGSGSGSGGDQEEGGSGAEQDGDDPGGSGCSRVRELTCSNMVSSALEFRERDGIESTCLAELLEKMHASKRWVLAGDVMRNGIPDLLFEEFTAGCSGTTSMTADLFKKLRTSVNSQPQCGKKPAAPKPPQPSKAKGAGLKQGSSAHVISGAGLKQGSSAHVISGAGVKQGSSAHVINGTGSPGNVINGAGSPGNVITAVAKPLTGICKGDDFYGEDMYSDPSAALTACWGQGDSEPSAQCKQTTGASDGDPGKAEQAVAGSRTPAQQAASPPAQQAASPPPAQKTPSPPPAQQAPSPPAQLAQTPARQYKEQVAEKPKPKLASIFLPLSAGVRRTPGVVAKPVKINGKPVKAQKVRPPELGLIMRKDGTCFYRHEDGTVEERGRL